ncbi:MAG: CoA-binding protein [Fibrobacter sp.]|jgi:predicted CoA-binding protein|nr:CoA-binding protein [Fibrobacter sp.]
MGFGSGISCCLIQNTVLTPEQRERYQNTDTIQKILKKPKTIAIVGISRESHKASNMVASYLKDEGYRIIPVNLGADSILGEKCYPDLLSIPEKVDLVDIFRPSHEVLPIVEQAISIKAEAVWMQLRIINFEAADKAIEAGLSVVVDKCIKMEHGRYSGGLHSAGMNTGIISARRSHWR